MEKILVSACLMGEKCRYDGKDNLLETIKELGKHYDLIPFCPEVESGLPTPRKPSEILRDQVIHEDGEDVTKFFVLGAEKALNVCKFLGIRIAVLKEDSPSCGVNTIHDGRFSGKKIKGQGFTARFLSHNGIKVYSESDLLSSLIPSAQDEEAKEKKKTENVEKAKLRAEKAAVLKKYTEECEAAKLADLPLPEKPALLVEAEPQTDQRGDALEGKKRFDRPFRKDGEKRSYGHRSYQKDGERRPYGEHSFHKDGDHPYHKDSYGEDGYKKSYEHSSFHQDGERKPYGEHSYGGEKKPYSPHPYHKYGEKSYGDHKPYDHPYHKDGEKNYGDHKPYDHPYHKDGENKPYGEKSYGDHKPYAPHPYHKYGEKSYGDHKPYDHPYRKDGEKPYASHSYHKDGPVGEGGYQKKEYGHSSYHKDSENKPYGEHSYGGEKKPYSPHPYHKYGEVKNYGGKKPYGEHSFHKDGETKSYGGHSYHKDVKSYGKKPYRSYDRKPTDPKDPTEKK